ncbi:MAG: M23 family metallopeptidase [Elusimicrobiota bacterium]|jgi:murein DD-endopeptidase MepM/ murein hydrolase activator NlpD
MAAGELLLVVVRDHGGPQPPVGRLGEEQLFFWSAGSGAYMSFAGLDMEASSGPVTLEVEAVGGDGAPVELRQDALVAPQTFPEQRLQVSQNFVTPRSDDESRAQRDHARLQELYARRTPARFFSGRFQEPLRGRISADFGERRVFNGIPKSPHGGLDIAAGLGRRVRAPAGGLVALADDLFYSGLTVILDHGYGLFSFYGHLSQLKVSAGAVVERGQVIGLVGATGRATGPHLHWSVRFGPARVDPHSLTALDLSAWAP